ncbi:MAG TPA: phosphoribosyl-ATP diphosphatase [Alphaproteobacteria bacterium]|nr:phosphoribosyl-ATP diphosphatase [Alphaproteobacteria bacterium]
MSDILSILYETLKTRRAADPAESYVAMLHRRGIDKIGGKIAEEAAETLIEAVRGDRARCAEESADLLFHLLVLWAHLEIPPADVFRILENRLGKGGHAEKAMRSGPDHKT